MDYIKLLEDNNIPYMTEGHKHCRPEWVQIECPFCAGNPGWHLGYDTRNNFFSCWRCGGKSIVKVISKIMNVDYNQAQEIVKQYRGTTATQYAKNKKQVNKHSQITLPSSFKTLTHNHRQYLIKRRFDPYKLEKLWDLKSARPGGRYRYRIITPIIWEGQIVSYQGRTISNKVEPKYKACREIDEIIHHKHIVYGANKITTRSIIVTEGVTDVWRLGPGAVATFGTGYTSQQVLQLAKLSEIIYIMFDSEPTAQKKARALSTELSLLGITSEVIKINKNDPGMLNKKEVNHYRKQLLI